MSQVLLAVITCISVIPDSAKSAIFIVCELFVAAVVFSPLVFRGTRGDANRSNPVTGQIVVRRQRIGDRPILRTGAKRGLRS